MSLYRRLLLVMAALLGASNAEAGNVVLVGKPSANKKFVIATDIGTSSGVKKGSKLCVYDKDDSEIACGIVVVAKASASSFFLEEAYIRSVKKGQRVELKAEAARTLESDDEKDEGDELSAADTVGTGQAGDKKLVARYYYGAILPIGFNGIGFNPESRTDAAVPAWTAREKVISASVGFGLTFARPLSSSLDISTSLIALQPDSVKGKTLMTSATTTEEVTATTAGRQVALTIDGLLEISRGSSWDLSGACGLAFLQSTVNVNAKVKAGTGSATTLVDYNAYLYALAIDLGAVFEYRLAKYFLLDASIMAAVPVATLAKGFSGSTDFTKTDLGESDHTLKGVDKGVDQKAGGVGINIGLGLGFAF